MASPLLVVAAVAVVMMVRTAGKGGACLDYLTCYDERHIDQRFMEIHHQDHTNRTASSCLPLCLRERPDTQLVMAKIIRLNERLVCGCGLEAALGNRTGTVGDLFGCSMCPDGQEKCGGTNTISVYVVEQGEDACRGGTDPWSPAPAPVPDPTTTTTTTTTTTSTTTAPPPPTEPLSSSEGPGTEESKTKIEYVGCVGESSVNRSMLEPQVLDRSGREALLCLSACTPASPPAYVFLRLQAASGTVYCGCGTSAALLAPTPLGEAEEQSCGASPHLGGPRSYAVYRGGGGRLSLPPCYLLLLVLVLVLLR